MTIVEDTTAAVVEPQEPAPKKKAAAKKSQEVAVPGPKVPAAPAVPSNLLDVIMRAGSDPNFDVDKFERLVAIQRDEQDRQDKRTERDAELAAESAFNAAMAQVQAKLTRIAPDAKNDQTKSVYATYAAIDRAIKPIYTEAGFSVSFNEEVGAVGTEMVRVVAYVSHVAREAKRGHTRTYHIDVPADGKGAKGGDVMTKTHAHGSGVSYAKRYLMGMIWNLAIGKDDDGNAAGDSSAATITALQLRDLEALITEVNANTAKVCQACHVESLAELTQAQFEKAKAKLEAMRAPL
jgi:hypothetical protein